MHPFLNLGPGHRKSAPTLGDPPVGKGESPWKIGMLRGGRIWGDWDIDECCSPVGPSDMSRDAQLFFWKVVPFHAGLGRASCGPDVSHPSSSVYWDYAMTIRLEEIVYLHCHQQGRESMDMDVPPEAPYYLLLQVASPS